MGNCGSSSGNVAKKQKTDEGMVQYEDEPTVEDDLDDTLQEADAPVKPVKRRAGVSAPAFDADAAAKKKKKVVPKSDADRAKIVEVLKGFFLFSSLDADALSNVADAAEAVTFAAGDVLIKQGDDGDFFYTVEEGTAEIWVKKGEEEDKMVATSGPGDSFGELALMYNAPRNATIKAISPMKCWAVDRDTFKITLIEAATLKRDRYEAFLDKVPILDELNKTEKLTIADALQSIEMKSGDVVITEGEAGDKFYIIEKGTVTFSQRGDTIGSGESGGYFGEIALLTSDTRQASVSCSSDCTLLTLDRATFVRTMGPLNTILKRNMDSYKKYNE